MKRMYKGISVLLLSACTSAISYGKPVDENTAKMVGCNQLISVGAGGVTTPADLVTSYVATTQGALGVTVDYYVFNIQGGNGFVMVSADDAIIPILAYSTESSFDINRIAPATKDWIDGYKNEIDASISSGYAAREGTPEKWTALMTVSNTRKAAKTTAVTKLLSSTWDQEPGYNNYTPVPGGSSSATPTGCVATSIAQVMRYWQWPTVGSGNHSYKPASYATRSADFGNTTYNWALTSMPLNANSPAIARLMSDVGIAVEMNYTPGESGAYTTIVERFLAAPYVGYGFSCSEYALKTYFHYKRSIHSVLRYDPTVSGGASTIITSTWIATLKTDIDNKRPILYSGQGTSGGHAWVCDGYDVSNNFHFNWGWSGASDGYFTVDNLNPPALGVGGGGGNFNYDQAVIMGIEPDSFANTTGPVKMLAHLDHNVNVPAQYTVSAITFNTKILNSNTTSFSGDFSLQMFDSALNNIGTLQTVTGKTVAAGDSVSLTFASTAALGRLVPGFYKFRVAYKATGATAWTYVADNGVFINENALDVENTQGLELASKLSLDVTPKIGKALTISSSFFNVDKTNNFNGDVKAILTNVATGVQTQVGATQSIIVTVGSTTGSYSFTTPSVSVTAGTYTVAIQHKPLSSSFLYTGSDFYQNPILVNIGYGLAGVNNVPSIADNISVYPNPANDVFNVKMDGVHASRITVTDIQGRQVQDLSANVNQSVLTVGVSNYTPGIYFVNVFTEGEVVSKKIVVAK